MKVRTFLITLVLLLPAAGANAQEPAEPEWAEGIGPGDVLVVTIWREPDLGISQTVPANGVINFQRIGSLDVRGLSADSVRRFLIGGYTRILVDVESRVQVEVHRKVRVSGAVRSPNIYTLHATMSLADALATAGGPLPEGRTDRVELRRSGEVLEILLLSESGALAESRIRSGDQLHVPERHFASRNLNVLVTAISGVLALTIAILAR